MSVFIAVGKADETMEVFPARNYQTNAYYTFMNDTTNPQSKKFNINNGEFDFKLVKFTSPTEADKRFCYLVNHRNESHVLSDNKESLKKFAMKYNRQLANGGSYKKPQLKENLELKKPQLKGNLKLKNPQLKGKNTNIVKKKGIIEKNSFI